MHPRRCAIVWLCLLALLWCQAAMAAHVCGDAEATDEIQVDCHDSGAAGVAGDPSCPGGNAVPDFGKLPAFAPLPLGHDYVAALASLPVLPQGLDVESCPRGGPPLDALCRLLI